ncbi:unnamed protein product, partial [marine sediment metagenome]
KHIILQSTDLEHLSILVNETDDFSIIGKVDWVIHKF